MEGVMLHQYLEQVGGKGKKILGGLDDFWNAFPAGITRSTLLKEDSKWPPMRTQTPTHHCHAFLLSAGPVRYVLGKKKKASS